MSEEKSTKKFFENPIVIGLILVVGGGLMLAYFKGEPLPKLDEMLNTISLHFSNNYAGMGEKILIGVIVIVIGIFISAIVYKFFPSLKASSPPPTPSTEKFKIEAEGELAVGYRVNKKYSLDELKEIKELLSEKEEKGEALPFHREDVQKLQDEIEKLKEEKQTDEIKHRLSSLTIGRDAAKIALEGKVKEARKRFEQAIAIYPEIEVVNLYGIYLLRRGELDDAISQFQKVVDIGEKSNERSTIAVGYGNLGIIYQTRGDLDKAVEFYEKALSIDKELGRKEGMANQYGNLGNVYLTRGDLEKAVEFYEKALKIHKELGSKEGMASDYGNLGLIYQTRGDLDRAEEFYEKALSINEELGRKEGMASDYGNLGNVYQKRGDLDKAVEFYEKSLKIDEELGRKEGMANQYGNLGNVYQTRGDLDKAVEFYEKSLKIEKELGRKEGMAQNKWNLSVLKEKQGNFREALELTKESHDLFEQVGIKFRVEEAGKWVERLQKMIEEREGK